MKFKTEKTSETGLKITAMADEMQSCHDASVALSKELGFTSFRSDDSVGFGGISCVMFDKAPDMKIWKKEADGFYPRPGRKNAKDIVAKFKALPTISKDDLNACVGLKSTGNQMRVGLTFGCENHYLFELHDSWDYEIPEDCEKILQSEFYQLQGL
jgi:hypothetical protein